MRLLIDESEVSKATVSFNKSQSVNSRRMGCDCGCNNNYANHVAQITRIINLYNSTAADIEVSYTKAGAAKQVQWKNAKGNRTFTIYLKG